ncbi:MAG: DUF5615 family PIN-like protein [Candidatus Dormibacteria bacterium]
MRLLLDEHFSPTIAEQLRDHGHDVVALVELSHLRSRPDEDVLDYATAGGRAVVTENVVDFVLLHEAWRKRGDLHSGIVLSSSRRFPRTKTGVGRLVSALADLLDQTTEDEVFDGRLTWLPEKPP